jgi:ferredoxin
MTDTILDEVAARLASHGMMLRGGFAPEPEDAAPLLADGRQARTLLLVGNAGPAIYSHFFAAHESAGGIANALDMWTRRVTEPIAAHFGALALFPSDGPPWHPSQRWAKRAEALQSSPLGILIHPQFGLWHAYRAALLLDREIALPEMTVGPHPCADCVSKPCLSTCPVGAVTPEGYAVKSCAIHVASLAGSACRSEGCLARRACPVGRDHVYPARAMEFHMAAFLKGQGFAD